jgi:hypothetical protein
LVDLAEIQAAYYMVAATGVLVAAIYYIYNMRISQQAYKTTLETRQAQLFMPIYNKFSELDHMKLMNRLWSIKWRDYDDFVEKYGEPFSDDADAEVYASIWSACNYHEGIGVLVKRNLIESSLVDDLISGSTIRTWEKFGPIILEMRRRMNYPQLYEWFEYLYDEVKGIAVVQHPELKSSKFAQ